MRFASIACRCREPVWVDHDMWEKIVLNLLSNAFKFTFEGEVRVALRPAPEGGAAELEVSDTGIGIPAGELPHLFERFHRVEGARGRTHKAPESAWPWFRNSFAFTAALSGWRAAPGKAACLPYASRLVPRTCLRSISALGAVPPKFRAPAAISRKRCAGFRMTGSPLPHSRTRRSLRMKMPQIARVPEFWLADDNADMRDYLRRLLDPHFDVSAVSNGARALEAAQKSVPDLVLADVMMPELDGFGLLQRLRSEPATAAIPVILLSARAGEEARVEGLAAGADDYLTKPFSARELLARVETHVKLAEARRRAAAEVKESELRFRRLFEGNIFGVAFSTFDGRVLDANDAYLRLVGYTRDDLNAGRLRWDVMTPPEYAEANLRGHQELRQHGRGAPFEKEYIRKDGSRVSVIVGGALLAEPWDAQDTYVVFCIDITERKKIEAQLREAQKLESLGVLAGGVAHDFNNLLVGILGNASLALDNTPSSNPNRTLLQDIVNAGQRAADLTRQLLAYAGKGRFVVEPLDVSALIKDIAALIQTSIPRNVQVHLDVPAGLPNVEADVSQLQQLVMNLIINGGEAIGDQNGMVLVTTGVQQVDEPYLKTLQSGDELTPGTYVFIEVEDSGCGMDSETVARIFDPFFTTKFMGRGLGLAAALGIVRGHRGTIKVDSQPGKGSTFKIFFPARPQASVIRPASLPYRDITGDGLVLVVDDEETVRRAVKSALQRYGYSVLVAGNGGEGVNLFREIHSELVAVVLDMTMPVMSGEEALRHMRELNPQVPVILSSGFNEVEAVRRFTGKGLAGFIQKP